MTMNDQRGNVLSMIIMMNFKSILQSVVKEKSASMTSFLYIKIVKIMGNEFPLIMFSRQLIFVQLPISVNPNYNSTKSCDYIL